MNYQDLTCSVLVIRPGAGEVANLWFSPKMHLLSNSAGHPEFFVYSSMLGLNKYN